MSFCKNENDEEEIEKIYNKIPENQKKKVEKYYYNGNIEEALNTIADSQLVVGGRFHANIIGLCLGKSILPVLYSDKTLHVLEDMQINTPIIDIRKLENFNIESIKDEDLTRHYNIEKQKEDAQRHFEKLDLQLKKT